MPALRPDGHLIPKHVAVLNRSTLVSSRELAFWAEAVNLQLRRDVAPIWDGNPPGVMVYDSAYDLPAKDAAVVTIVDSDGNDASVGYHAQLGNLVFAFIDAGQSACISRTLSHEIVELYANPRLDRICQAPDGKRYYVELCAPVQADDYLIEVTLFGETQSVRVCDFVYPSWYGVDAVHNTKPYHHLAQVQQLDACMIADGGYALIDDNGHTVFKWSDGSSGGGSDMVQLSLSSPRLKGYGLIAA